MAASFCETAKLTLAIEDTQTAALLALLLLNKAASELLVESLLTIVRRQARQWEPTSLFYTSIVSSPVVARQPDHTV